MSSQDLIRITKKEPDALGISLEAAGKIPLDDAARNSILKCLFDTDPDEIGWGLWFCQGLLAAGRLDPIITDTLIQHLADLVESNDYRIRKSTRLRNRVPQYNDWMRRFLRDPYHHVRCIALLNCKKFLPKGEVAPLLNFRTDPHYEEISMMGPLVYSLRDEALRQIEQILGRTFDISRLSETIEGGDVVGWRDWSPFMNWWNSPWRRFWARLKVLGKP
jgi:hypothetical protein